MTLFQQVKNMLNSAKGKPVSKQEISLEMYKLGYLVKNPDNTIYDLTIVGYLSRLKAFGYINYNTTEEIHLIKRIPSKLKASDIKRGR